MKVTFTIEETGDGVLLLMDPPVGELMLQALAGQSGMAAALALTAYQNVLQAMLALHGPEHVEHGDIPQRTH